MSISSGVFVREHPFDTFHFAKFSSEIAVHCIRFLFRFVPRSFLFISHFSYSNSSPFLTFFLFIIFLYLLNIATLPLSLLRRSAYDYIIIRWLVRKSFHSLYRTITADPSDLVSALRTDGTLISYDAYM